MTLQSVIYRFQNEPFILIRKLIVDTDVVNEVTVIFSSTDSRRAVVSYWRKYGYLVLVKRSGCLRLPRNSAVK